MSDLLKQAHDALAWYRDEALAIALNLQSRRTAALTASIDVLSKDAGNRAITVMALIERERVAALAAGKDASPRIHVDLVQEREQFEEYARGKGWSLERLVKMPRYYESPQTDGGWDAWRFRASRDASVNLSHRRSEATGTFTARSTRD